ncbi:altered inheritance of mitochondria protein 3-like isoform X2 [Ostrinia furnacalis]|uniref:altered inheritance of mitochondria protein 3-like isoform X2 n=1 Tax=Ostrinia furnacalis TaxID=93504 RepID=UPI00103D4E9C|nr:altered inheritance of mitochondria protein 3-like isoform X2 [Ostrinia furnacalis]
MAALARLVVLCLVACACAQYQEERAPRYIASESKNPSTPVPILKQINRHNEDGSYTYGYEAADGSFKIETKSPSGEVKGKYGYKDDTGKLRVIEYGANKYGFQPAGEGITVAPPTLVDESTRDEGLRPQKSQGGNRNQYRAPAPQQSIDYDYNDEPAPRPAPRPAPAPAYRAPQPRPQPPPQPQYRPQPQPQPQQYRPAPQPQQQYRPPPQSAAPAPPKPTFFAGAAPAPAPAQDNNNFFNPEPQQRQYKQQDFRPAPQFAPKPQIEYAQDFAPAPPQPRYNQNQFPQQRNQQPFSMLDQLLKEYALPSGGAAPLHDITFGSY